MSQTWMPIFGYNNKVAPASGMLLGGSIATLIGLWFPLFAIDRRRGQRMYSLWDLREVGAPGLPVLVFGAVLLVVAGFVGYRRHIPRAWLSCLAVAETLGILVALSIGFTITFASLDYPASTSITFNPGLLILIGGLTATLVGSWQQPKSQGHRPEPAEQNS
ncbi:hypothetical protein ACWZHB_33585 [Nocardia sp. FBN12]|uniref:hypothetical protein n=1 Tax=Nocardia sp. FBN12 TaxID=3419766 RepID=UPI003CFE323A